MKVLSLFDGMSCGQVALGQAGIPVEEYYASEIDKHAIKVTQSNYPETVQVGDVTKISAKDLPKIDLVIGGSPCQGFSFAGKQLNFDDPRSALFFEFVRILNEIRGKNPDVKFLLENVRMKKEFQDVISEHLGVFPIMINSNLVSAQNRVRYYWTNINGVQLPEDRGIYLKDVLDDGENKIGARRGRYKGEKTVQMLEERKDNKSNTLTTVQKDNIVIRKKSKCVRAGGRGSYDRHEWDSIDSAHTRKLTILECERLQTLPDNYTAHTSATQRFKMLGNGWTVDVIAHIFRNLK